MSGELPKGWAEATLGDIADYVQRGKSPKYAPTSALPVINQKCVRWWGIDRNHLKYISEEQWSSWDQDRYIRNGDILWNSTGTGTIGRAALYESSELTEKIVCDSHVTILRMNDEISKKYVYWHIRSPSVQNKIESMQTGSTNQVELGKGEILSTPIPLAPKPEQTRIVEKIDALFERSRAAREELARIPKLIERYRQAVLEAAFRGDLTADWREESPVRCEILDEAYDIGQIPQLCSTPKTWRWRRLDQISYIQGGLAKGKKRSANEELLSVPYLRVANVQKGYLDLDDVSYIEATKDEISRLALIDGDILFNEGGDRDKLGRGWVWDCQIPLCIHQNHVFRARIRDRILLPRLLSYFGNSFGPRYFFDEGKQTTNLASLSKSKLSAFPVPVMPLDEQAVLLSRIEAALAVIDIIEHQFERATALVPRLDQAILDKAFRGELVPQDPNDEPASVLLERIKAARAAAPAPRRGRRAKPAE